MIRRSLAVWVAFTVPGAGVCLLSGCGSPLGDGASRAWLDHDPGEWRATPNGAMHSAETVRSDVDHADAPATERPPGIPANAGPDDYVALALARNPAIVAARRRVERLRLRLPQVTSLDDPMFSVAPVGEMAQTAAGEVGLMTGVSQKIPFPGKLEARGQIVAQDVAMALADLRQRRLEVTADTRRAYWSYYFAARAIETTRDSRDLLSQFQQVAETEYRAGTRGQTDVLRASLELSNLDNDLVVLDQRSATAKSMLNQLLDRPVDAALPDPPVIELEGINADLDALLASAAQHNPTLRKIRDRIEQFRRRRALAKLDRWPDLTVSVSYNAVDDEGLSMAANGRDQWWLGLGVNLPIWAGKYEAAEREALLGVLEGVGDLAAAQNHVAFAVRDAYLRVEAQQKLVALFHDVIVPQARQTVEASDSGYRAGSVDFLTLVDNWRKLLTFDVMYHRAVADAEQAVADLERAVGEPVARRGDPVTPLSGVPAQPTSDAPQPRRTDPEP